LGGNAENPLPRQPIKQANRGKASKVPLPLLLDTPSLGFKLSLLLSHINLQLGM